MLPLTVSISDTPHCHSCFCTHACSLQCVSVKIGICIKLLFIYYLILFLYVKSNIWLRTIKTISHLSKALFHGDRRFAGIKIVITEYKAGVGTRLILCATVSCWKCNFSSHCNWKTKEKKRFSRLAISLPLHNSSMNRALQRATQ